MDTIQIGLGDGNPQLALQGAGVAVPVRGALFRESRLLGNEQIEQVIDLSLEGTAAEIESCLQKLGRELAMAASQADRPGGAYRYLEARARSGGALLRSKLLGGWVELLDGGAGLRAVGTTGARLHLTRLDYWEAGLTWLPITNGNGSRITTGLTIYNHQGSLAVEDNQASALAADALGELPAPALLIFVGLDTTNTGTLYAGQAVNTPPVDSIEGEHGTAGAGVTGTLVNDTAASDDQYNRLDWSGTAELTVWKHEINSFTLSGFGGRPFLPVLRLHTGTVDALWFYWRVTVNYAGIGQVAYDCPGSWMLTGTNHCPGSPLFMPPWPLAAGEFPPSVGLELRVKASSAGAHSLQLDVLHLLPLDHWRVYRPSVGTYSGMKITDDPYNGTLKAGDWAIQMHQAEGPGLVVAPGLVNRYAFLMERSGGGFTPATRATVRIGYRPRTRGL